MQDEAKFRTLLERITADTATHARFLNTLSYMEHVGATKIAGSQSGPSATFMTLKHASEEARHAWYLKKLALRLAPGTLPDYADRELLAPVPSRQYLHRLDVAACRMCRRAGLEGKALKDLAYLLVTWAIEVRADALYPVYQEFLSRSPIKLSVASIINEEVGHLEEMNAALAAYPQELRNLTHEIAEMEASLFDQWVKALEQAIAGAAVAAERTAEIRN